ncbi:lysylphosphatidylglycerol synthase transmembrane domain-containing protein [Haloarcula onubensis]|uniref:Flippase-like domain-containing protein n=1 Tax=Haloarcula onubensis TaxID=2950539 RepID=A0ABU2FMS5_9EURY|nr:lysylphosphatidylglycerol synthase transmembrane domain-containing protein [Halomicroarcula sp. S3CR25-11]MDS0282061.1 flippase-like domain-containing protein [Halomicroarcula sp. S3CR25-11]
MTASRRDVAISVLQYGVGLAALAFLLSQVDVQAVSARLRATEPTVLVALVLVTVGGVLARFDTWRAVLSPFARVPLLTAGRVDLAVNFVNQLLPSRLSGRLAAPFILRAETGVDYGDATAAAGAHTGIYAVWYGVVSAVGLLVIVGRVSTGLLLLLALSTALYLVAGAVVLLAGLNLTALDRLVGSLAALAERVPRIGSALAGRVRSVPDITEASADAFGRISTNPRVWLRYAAGWVLALVVAPGIRVWLLFLSFGAAVDPLLLPLYLVTAYSITLLPLTPGGIGVTEATATAVFVGLGVPEAVVIPVIFLDRFLGVYLPALAGWYPTLDMDLSVL